ncbi:FAD-dependent oxidoreductase [Arabiibacter massiliensis]|uniref:FAD-dependent oxidoreductase n=1 Tax=Arabiibacter massiliensis TaxID=1870985 RepID=UPI0009B9E58B|nr:flavocytochrome c [Arabiibacter massiliensis]
MDRKRFLQTGLVATAAAAASLVGIGQAFAAPETEKTGEEGFDEVVDVIVVGSGLAGTVAAVTAAEAGSTTLLLEKMDQLGGTSSVSGLNFACTGSEEQAAEGIEDDPELLYQDMRKVADDYGDPELARIVTSKSVEFYRFLTERGVTFKKFKNGGGHSVKRILWAGGGRFLLDPLYEHAAQNLSDTLEARTRCKVDDLVMRDGKVVGVVARQNYSFDYSAPETDDAENTSGQARRIGARKGVIFATGGYARDKNLLRAESAILAQADSMTNPGATSGAMKMLVSHGAQAVNLSLFRLSYPIPTEDVCWGMLVNPDGQRFVNELGSRNDLGVIILKEMLEHEGKPPLLMYDSKGIELFRDKQRLEMSLAGRNFKNGSMYAFDTIDEMAEHFGYDKQVLADAVARYNEMIDKGVDEDFGKDMTALNGAALKQPPFYGMNLIPNNNYTPGGVRINVSGQVLDENGSPIDGLYAAGEATGGVHGAQRLTACSCPDCGAFGMVCGTEVSAREASEL